MYGNYHIVCLLSLCKSDRHLYTSNLMVDSYAQVHYTPPCFEGVGPLYEDNVLATHRHGEGSSYPVFLSEDAVWDTHQCRDGSINTGTGAMH